MARMCFRNKQAFWYALYGSTVEQYDEYGNQRQNRADVYYNTDGTVRRAPGAQNQRRQRPADDETRTFSIPEQYNRRR